jgi:pimeloyl-ACP methyl ester carboxylesterase
MSRAAAPLAAIGLALLTACAPPPDPGRARPGVVRATPFAQRDLVVGGLRIRYVDEGPREPRSAELPLLLIPGHTSRVEEYDVLVGPLSLRRRVLVLDFPGSGYAEKPDREYTLALYEDTALGFLDALGVARAHVGGGSLGGNLALRLAHRAPERFERLVPWAPGGAWEARPRIAGVTRRFAGMTLFWPTVWIQSRFWYEADWPGRDAALADTFAYYREVLGPGFVRMYFGIAADLVEHSLFDVAREIPQPTWLGWGDRDHGADMGAGVARVCALLPRCELRVFPGARHSLAAEIPEALAASLEEFLTRPADRLPARRAEGAQSEPEASRAAGAPRAGVG